MTWDIAKDVLLDALKDSALVLAFVFAFHLLLSFIEFNSVLHAGHLNILLFLLILERIQD